MIRVATLNVENLFDRPKILNLEDTARTTALLKEVDALQRALARPTYNAATIGAIERSLAALRGYVTIRVDRGSLFKGMSRSKIGAGGSGDWKGAVELSRDRFNDKQRKNTAALLDSVRADVACLVEVEGRREMSDFAVEYFPPARRMGRNMLIDSPIDPRGIDIGLAWRGAGLGVVRSNVYDARVVNGRSLTVWSRDCLEVELLIAGGRRLHLLCNHFKSKMGGDPPASRSKREAQATRASEILRTRYDLRRDLVILLGDLNDVPGSAALAPLLSTSHLHDVLDLVGRPADDRWTYYYGRARVAERKTQIDYILVSEALRPHVRAAEVWRRGMSAVAEGKVPGITPLPGITGWRNAASDHAAVSVDLDGLDVA